MMIYYLTNIIWRIILQVNMQRRSVLYIANFLLPVLFFLCLDFASLLMSDTGGEKIGFKITVLLAVTVMQLILNDILPSSSDKIPLIGTAFVTHQWGGGNTHANLFFSPQRFTVWGFLVLCCSASWRQFWWYISLIKMHPRMRRQPWTKTWMRIKRANRTTSATVFLVRLFTISSNAKLHLPFSLWFTHLILNAFHLGWNTHTLMGFGASGLKKLSLRASTNHTAAVETLPVYKEVRSV